MHEFLRHAPYDKIYLVVSAVCRTSVSLVDNLKLMNSFI